MGATGDRLEAKEGQAEPAHAATLEGGLGEGLGAATRLYAQFSTFAGFLETILPEAVPSLCLFANDGVVGLAGLVVGEDFTNVGGQFCRETGEQDARGGGVQAMDEVQASLFSRLILP